jgi:DNA repair protein RadC
MEQLLAPIAAVDSRCIANRLVDEFGSFSAALSARPSHLARILPDQPAILQHIRSVAGAFDHHLRLRLQATSVAVSIEEAVAFLQFRIGFATIEILYVLYFNSLGYLIYDAPLSHGGLTSCEVQGRAIAQIALDVGAAGVVLAHNHPAGDPTPSNADIQVTRRIHDAFRVLDIGVYDHLVICRDRYESLRAKNLF